MINYSELNNTIRTFLMSYGIPTDHLMQVTEELVGEGRGDSITLLEETEIPTNGMGPMRLIMKAVRCEVKVGIYTDNDNKLKYGLLDVRFNYNHHNSGSNGKAAEFVVMDDGFNFGTPSYHLVPREIREAVIRHEDNKREES